MGCRLYAFFANRGTELTPAVWECFSYNTNQMYLLPNAQIQWAGQNFCWDLTDGRGEAGNQIQVSTAKKSLW